MVFIYSLKLQRGKYYIGKTDKPTFRLEDHFASSGSAWTKKYKPISIYQLIPDMSDHDEQRITQEYMNKYGIDNVRGGPWCKVVLSDEERLFIQNLLDGENDKCYQCGSSDHFAKDCKMYQKKPKHTKNTCERCGRFGHSEETCYAKTDSNGRKIIDEETFKKVKNSKIIIYFPSSKELDILNIKSIKRYLKSKKPKYFIHAAGLSRPMDLHDKNITKIKNQQNNTNLFISFNDKENIHKIIKIQYG